MNYVDQPRKLQVEIGNFCNAECLGCVRTSNDALQRIEHEGHFFVEPDAFKNILLSETGKHIQQIEFCGNIDEPLAHPKFFEILDVIYHFSPSMKIEIHTNGAVKDTAFHKKLGEKILKFQQGDSVGSSSKVRYSIDGLADSVYTYRGLKNYNKIIENAKAYISTGAPAVWQMLTFPWNEHEVEQCKNLSREMGFDHFNVRIDRSHASSRSKEWIDKFRSRDRKINKFKDVMVTDDLIDSLESDRAEKYYNLREFDWSAVHNIDCFFSNEKALFIDHKSRVWPCCFLANPEFRNKYQYAETVIKLYKKYGEHFNNLKHNSFDSIMSNNWYAEELTSSWNEKHELQSGCMSQCINQCTKNSIPIAQHIIHEA